MRSKPARTGGIALVALLLSSVWVVSPVAARDCAGVSSVRPDGWQSIAVAFDLGPQVIEDYVVDLYDPRTLLATNGQVVVRSLDAGCSWHQVFTLQDLPANGDALRAREINSISSLAISEAPSEPGVIYALLSGRIGPHVAVSSDFGETWRWADWGLPVLGDSGQLRVAPGDPSTAYVTISVGGPGGPRSVLYSTTDRGERWAPATPDLLGVAASPTTQNQNLTEVIRVDRFDSQVLYSIKLPRTIIVSPDGGRTWLESATFREDEVGTLTDLHVYQVTRNINDVAVGEYSGDLILLFAHDPPESYWSWTGGLSYLSRGIPGVVESAAIGRSDEDVVVATDNQECQVAINHPESQSWICVRSRAPVVRDVSLTRADPQILAISDSADPVLERLRMAWVAGQTFSPETSTLEWFDVGGCGLASLLPSTPRSFGPARLTPANEHVYLHPGESAWRSYSLRLPPLPTPIDVDFLMDTTGSMGPTICALRQAVQELINDLAGLGIDVHYGVGQFKDYPMAPYGWPQDFPYRREYPIGPPSMDLVYALTRLIEGGGLDGPEANLPALFQSATGAGQLPYVPPGMDSGFRDESLKVIVHMTDTIFHDEEAYPGPSFEETLDALKQEHITQIGVAARSTARRDLERTAEATGAIAPPGGLDCNDDGMVDILAGAPMVCAFSESEGTVMSDMIVELLSAIKDLGEVELVAQANSRMISEMTPPKYPSVNLRAEHTLDFDVRFSCDPADMGTVRAVPLVATVKGRPVAEAVTHVHCIGLPRLVDSSPPLPLAPVISLPPQVPPNAPNPGPQPQAQQQPQQQAQQQAQQQGQAQAAAVPQRQEQPQMAFVHAARQLKEQTHAQYAMSRLSSTRRDPVSEARFGLALGALSLLILFGNALVLTRQLRHREARWR